MSARNRSLSVLTLAVVAIATLVLATTPLSVQAADLYWDSDDANPGAGGATPTGTWGTDSYWSTSPAGNVPTGAWTAGDIAIFAAGADAFEAYTVTANGAIDIGGLTFEEGDVTISAGSLQLVSNITVAVNTGTSTLDTVIAENIMSRTLTKSGDGTLVLSGINTYSGGTVLDGGMLVFAADANLGDPAGGGIVVNSDSALRPSSMTTDRTLEINNGAIANFDGSPAGVSFTMNGAVTGNGGVTLNNTPGKKNARLTFASTSNTFTGPIMISGPDYRAEVTFNSLADSSNPITFTGGNASREYLGLTWGSGAASPLVLDNRQIVLDGLTGNAQISNRNTLSSNANTITINTDLSVINTGSGKALTLSGINKGDNTFAGVIGDGSSAGFGIKKTDAGKWILSGDNTYTGSTTITGGTLSINSIENYGVSSPIGAPTSGDINLGSGTTTATKDHGTLLYTGSGDSTDRTIRIGKSTSSTSYKAGGRIHNSGSGALIFTADIFNTSIGNAKAPRKLTLGGSYADGTSEIQGVIQDNGGVGGTISVYKEGNSAWALSGDNIYTGSTNVYQGTLSINSIEDFGVNSPLGAPASGDIKLGNSTTKHGTLLYTGSGDSTNRTFKIGNNDTRNHHKGSGLIINDGSGPLIFTAAAFNTANASAKAPRTLTLGGTYIDGTSEIQGVIQDNGGVGGTIGVIKTGHSTWALNGVNTYTGTTVVNAGKLGGTGTIAGEIIVNPGGAIAPGASIGTLNGTDLTWNTDNVLAGMSFELSDTDNTSDLLNLSGTLTKGGEDEDSTSFIFDLIDGKGGQTYTLMNFAGTDFELGDFAALPGGIDGVFALNTTNLQYIATLTSQTWNGGAGDWNDDNWTPAGPGAGKAMVIDSGTVMVPTTPAAAAGSLAIGGGVTGGTVEIAQAATLSVTDETSIGDGGTLGVNGRLSTGGLSVAAGGTLGLGAGATIVSPAATAGEEVTITIDGTLGGGNGVSSVGEAYVDIDNGDLGFTHLALAAGSTYEWAFSDAGGLDDQYVYVNGELTLDNSITIRLIDAGGVANNESVVLLKALGFVYDDLSAITIEKPGDWTIGSLVVDGGTGSLILQNLVTVATGPLPGDANNNGTVGDADWAIFKAQFGGAPGGIGDDADFNNDGRVDLRDLAILDAAWDGGAGAPELPGSTATPEPATMSLLALGGLLVLRRRRRKA